MRTALTNSPGTLTIDVRRKLKGISADRELVPLSGSKTLLMRKCFLLPVLLLIGNKIVIAQNVGIGTAAPSAPLHIRNASVTNLLKLESSRPTINFAGNTGFIFAQLSYTDSSMRLNTIGLDKPIVIAPNNFNTALFNSSGSMGLGTLNPAARFHVRNAFGSEIIRVEGDRPFITLWDVDSGYRAYWRYDGDVIIGTSTTYNTAIRIAPRATSAARFLPDGRTHFGTGQPAVGYLVSINGRMICTEARVQLAASWPDSVFDNDYAILSIGELEKYIMENRRLPGIPSAEQMKAGQDLGEIQRRMMEKIEELALYIIQLKKQNDDFALQLETIRNKK